MSVLITRSHITFNYTYSNSVEKITKFIDDKQHEFDSDLCFIIVFDTSNITQTIYNSVEYVLNKVPKIDKIVFKIGYSNYINTSDNMIKLLHIFDNIDSIILEVNLALNNNEHHANVITELLEFMLCNMSTKKLGFNTHTIVTDKLLGIIENNFKIKSVYLTFGTNNLKYLNIPFQKIYKISISGNINHIITYNEIINMFNFAPNLTCLYFYCFRNEYGLNGKFIHDSIMDQIVKFITNTKQFNVLYFDGCCLSDESIKYMCNQFGDSTDIRSILFKDSYTYNDTTIYCIANMIKNNKYLAEVQIGRIGSVDALYEILNSVTNSNVKQLILDVRCGEFNEYNQIQDTILQILSDDYLLIKIDIILHFNDTVISLDASSITNRNIELMKERRFVNTKKVISLID